MTMSLLSEKFAQLEAEYRANIEALRDAAGVVNEAESVAEALTAALPDISGGGIVSVCCGHADIRIVFWSPMHMVRQAVDKAGLVVMESSEGTLCGEPCDVIKLQGISVPLMIERKPARVAA